ncbi:DMT family transporter [Pontibacillus sp. ALD_SL1]|uniref:EamA family transporter n=1 Tax=Pontibacillus sp. ALD_SL1 TaxID=2777185 RepID=UPI001F619F3E|nr:DMT family transporter [Pontibacillus sp. ALD_SL1]
MRYIIAVFIGACSYGVLSTIVKLAYRDGATTSLVTVGQFLIGWSVLFVCFLLTKRKEVIGQKDKVKLMLAGIPTGLVGVFYYLSLITIEASLAIILLFQFVWIGILFEFLIYRRIPDKVTIFSVFILMLGTTLASGVMNGADHGANLLGVIYGLLAAVSFALFILTNATVLPKLRPIQRSYYMVTGSMVVVVMIFSPILIRGVDPSMITSFGQFGILLGLFGVVIPPLLFAYGMPQIGSALGSILGSAELPVAVLLSMVILEEHVTVIQWCGVAITIFGIVYPNIHSRSG